MSEALVVMLCAVSVQSVSLVVLMCIAGVTLRKMRKLTDKCELVTRGCQWTFDYALKAMEELEAASDGADSRGGR